MIAPRLARAPRGRHSSRRHSPRPKVIAPLVLARLVRSEHVPRMLPPRPRSLAECPCSRPCPWVGCQYHLYLDVTEHGSIRFNFPDLEPWELPVSCAFDLARLGGLTLDEVGIAMNITRERVRQLMELALREARAAAQRFGLEGS